VAARVELFEAIRADRRREQLSVRALAERHQVHRRTVRQALDSAVPPVTFASEWHTAMGLDLAAFDRIVRGSRERR
jgi:hypothetical protein